MKNKKLFTALIVGVLVLSVGTFHACQKEDAQNQEIDDYNNVGLMEKDYNVYIEELIAATGIDIYEISGMDEMKELVDKQLILIEMASEISHLKGELTEEKLNQMQTLKDLMDEALAAGDEYEALRLYESFCNLCMTIDGFIFDMDEYGMQTFTYDPDSEPLHLPLTYMEIEATSAVALISKVEKENPQFPTLPSTTQTEIMTAAVYVNMMRSLTSPKAQQSQDECRQAALADYGLAMAGCIAGLELALHICAGAAVASGGTLAPGCVGGAFAGYGVAVGFATWGYKRALKRCG